MITITVELAIDDGTVAATYQNITRSTYPIYNGNVVNASSTALTNDIIQRAADRVEIISNSGKVDKLISRQGQRRKYLDIVLPQKRFNDDALDAGFSKITWNGIDWYIDVDAKKNTLYGITTNSIKRYEIEPIKFDDKGGSVIKWSPGYDKVIAYAVYYANLGSPAPNQNFKIQNLTEPTF